MSRTDYSLTQAYFAFTSAFIAASMAMAAAIHFQLLSLNLSLIVYTLVVVIMISLMLGIIKSKMNSTIRRMDIMLDQTTTRPAALLVYDETKLSVLEHKLYRLLTTSVSSTNSIAQEKDCINTLVSDISHQTKTPISNILLYAELLGEQGNLNEESRQLLEQIRSQSDKLAFLIQALVKTSRLETGIISVNPQPTSVYELIDNSIRANRGKAEDKKQTITISCSHDLSANFDGKWTEEALVNLLDNAVKYSPAGSTIAVSAASYEMFARIDVSDQGIGISEGEYNQIFRRFYRSPAVSQTEGLGIGLYLVREILAAEGGYAKVSSERNRGSVFSMFLPKAII